MIAQPTDLQTARHAYAEWLTAVDRGARFACLHDCDADGVASGVLWQRGLERLGYTDLVRVLPTQERNPWTTECLARVADVHPQALAVLDLGSEDKPIVDGIPSCYIDHHRPDGIAPGALLICSYSWETTGIPLSREEGHGERPILNTSMLMWELLSPLVDIADLDWVAAVGAISDLGEKVPFPLVETAKKKYTAKYLKEVTTMVNAARRASTYEPEVAAQALLTHTGPRALVDSTDPAAVRLRELRVEVSAALAEAKKAAPRFVGNVALIRIHSRCQVHPLIAQIWRSRLPGKIVIAANTGFVPDRVSFSVRSGPGLSVLEFLGGITLDLAEGEGKFGRGHDQASGGSIPFAQWDRMLQAIGFEPKP